ncbi:Gluconate transport-inducing protein [Coemansia sp. RSA 1365]|nr:Gluconate transport-inducing protein [Coemansia sp. RSA 1365]
MDNTRMETYYGFVSTSEDALALFEACRLGYKQRVPRRLSDGERAAIRSGSIFVWEESESGMKRWTDGRSWSPSRVQGCFLTYHEWEGRRRAQRHPSFHSMHGFNLPMNMHNMHGQPIPMGIARYGHFIGGPTKAGSTQVQYGFPKENGMLKKALSIRTTDGKKLHIIAYYSKEDHAQRRLLTPTTDPNFPKLVVPPNLYPDMSPESMYGASHAITSTMTGGEAEAGIDPLQSSGMVARDGACSQAGANPGGSAKDTLRLAQREMRAGCDTMDTSDEPWRAMHTSPETSPTHGGMRQAAGEVQRQAGYTQPRRHAARKLSPLRPLYAHATGAADTGPSAIDALSAGLNKARVQSLALDRDVPASASLFSAQQLHHASRPAAEQLMRPYPHTAHPMSAPSSMGLDESGGIGGTRPTSNSFSGGLSYTHNRSHAEAPLGLSTSSASAPASTVMRSTAVDNAAPPMISEPHALPPLVSEATLMQAHSDAACRRDSGGDGKRKYLGLGGPLGLGRAGARRSTPLRSATTAAVMVHHPFANGSLPASAAHMPLLLSPVSAAHLGGAVRSGSFSSSHQPSINLAGIGRDVPEGPRRLPSISAGMRLESPPPCSPGGLGIFHAAARTPLLPSPQPTPRQSLPGAFDAAHTHQRGGPDSLALLASAADRSQVRRTAPQRNASSGHHPYLRAWRREPTARSVSFKQSEDIRQLGALDQTLRLK